MARFGSEAKGEREGGREGGRPRKQHHGNNPHYSPGLMMRVSKKTRESFGPIVPLAVIVLPAMVKEVVLAAETIWLTYVPSSNESMT